MWESASDTQATVVVLLSGNCQPAKDDMGKCTITKPIESSLKSVRSLEYLWLCLCGSSKWDSVRPVGISCGILHIEIVSKPETAAHFVRSITDNISRYTRLWWYRKTKTRLHAAVCQRSTWPSGESIFVKCRCVVLSVLCERIDNMLVTALVRDIKAQVLTRNHALREDYAYYRQGQAQLGARSPSSERLGRIWLNVEKVVRQMSLKPFSIYTVLVKFATHESYAFFVSRTVWMSETQRLGTRRKLVSTLILLVMLAIRWNLQINIEA